jgi:hypothetical protein
MKKLSSYQKIKAENEKLRKQIHTLVIESGSTEADAIRKRVKMSSNLAKSAMFGSAQNKGGACGGLLGYMGGAGGSR